MMIRITTFNILGTHLIDFKDLQRDYPTINAKDLTDAKRMPRVVKHLKASKADIMMLQEVTLATRKYIEKQLGPKFAAMALSRHNQTNWTDDHDATYGNTTILNKEKFSNMKHKTMYLHKSGTAYSVTTAKIIESAQKIMIVNIHLDSQDGKLRRSESAVLLKYLRPFRKTHVIVVGGDFNTDDKLLHEKWVKYQCGVAKPTGTFLCEKPMIDYIYVSGMKVIEGHVDNSPMKNEKVCFIKTIKMYGTDHYPVHVKAKLIFKKSK